jgi:hypothetical protein
VGVADVVDVAVAVGVALVVEVAVAVDVARVVDVAVAVCVGPVVEVALAVGVAGEVAVGVAVAVGSEFFADPVTLTLCDDLPLVASLLIAMVAEKLPGVVGANSTVTVVVPFG